MTLHLHSLISNRFYPFAGSCFISLFLYLIVANSFSTVSSSRPFYPVSSLWLHPAYCSSTITAGFIEFWSVAPFDQSIPLLSPSLIPIHPSSFSQPSHFQ